MVNGRQRRMIKPHMAHSDKERFSQKVNSIAERKLKAQKHVTKTVWSGLGMMGLIGWSVAIPTVLGAALGLWLEKYNANGRSWTLMLLIAGLCIGCFNAWCWIDKEEKDMHREDKGEHHDG